MKTVVSKRGQTVVPAAIRARYRIAEGDGLLWIDEDGVIRVVPVSADPIEALRGAGSGEGLVDKLLAQRRRDRERGA